MHLSNCHWGSMLTHMYQGESVRASQAAAQARMGYERLQWGRMARNVVRMEC